MKLLIMQFSPASCHFISLRSSVPCPQTPSLYFPPLISETKFHPHTEHQMYTRLLKLLYCHLSMTRLNALLFLILNILKSNTIADLAMYLVVRCGCFV
jgi:hypothetical protein